MAVDGSLIFNTKIDDDGFNKGTKGMSAKVVDLKNKISSTEAAIRNLKAEMEKTANTKVKTKVAEGLERDLAKAKQKLDDFYAQADRIGDAKQAELKELGFGDDYLDKALAQDKAWQQVQEKIAQAETQVQRYEKALSQANEAAPLAKDTADFQKKQQRLSDLSGQLEVYKAKLRETEQTETSAFSVRRHLERTLTALRLFEKGAQKAGNALKSAFSKSAGRLIQNIGSHFRRANSSTNILEKSLKRIKNTLVRMFFFRLVHSPLDAVKDGLGEIAKVSPEVNKNLSALKTESTYLKNSLAALAAPLVNLVTPAFTGFMQMLSGVTEKAGQLVSVLTGQNYTKAVKVQQDYAASLDDSTAAANKNTKALEKNQNALAGFDELNVLNQSEDSSETAAANPLFEVTDAQGEGLSKALLDSLKNQDFEAVGRLLGDKINSGLQKIRWGNIKSTLKKYAGNIADFLNGFIERTDWGLVGSTISNGISAAFDFVNTFIRKFNFSALSKGIVDAITHFNFADVGRGAMNLINGFAGAIEQFDFKQIGSAFRSGLSRINWTGIWNSVTRLMSSALKGLTDFFGLKGINTSKLKNALRDIAKPVGELYGTLKESAAELLTPIVNDFLPETVNFLGSVLKAVKPIVKSVTPIAKKTIEVITNITKNLAPVVETLGETIGSIVDSLSPVIQPVLGLISGISQLLAPAVQVVLQCVKGITEFLAPINQVVGNIFGWFTGGSSPTISAQLQEELDHLSNVSDDFTHIRDNINSAISAVDENLAATQGDLDYIDNLQSRMEELLRKSTLTEADMQELNTIADLISDKLPEFESTWNSMITVDEKGNLAFTKNREDVIKSIDNVIDKLQQQYRVEALEEQYKALYRDKAEAAADYSGRMSELTAAQEEYTKAVNDASYAETLRDKLYEAWLNNQADEKLQDAYLKARDNADKANANLSIYKEGLDKAAEAALIAGGKQGELNQKLEQMSNALKIASEGYDPLYNTMQELRDAADLGVIDLDTIEEQYGVAAKKLYAGSKEAAAQSAAGYKKGVDESAESLKEMGIDIADSVLKGAHEGFDQHSPSKEFEKISDYNIQGLEVGVEKRTPTLLNLIKFLAAKMTAVMQTGLTGFANTFDVLPELLRGKFNTVLSLFEEFLARITAGIDETFLQINQLNQAFAESGGSSESFTTWSSMPSIHIPRLATGTVIPANYGEFLAVLGDNKREAEVVSPVSAMKQAFLEAIAEGNFSGGDGEKEINLYIDGDKFFTWLIGKNNRYQKAHGRTAFGGGNL